MVFSIGRFRSLLSIREQASFLLVAALALGWIACADSVSAEEGKTAKSNPNVLWLQGEIGRAHV